MVGRRYRFALGRRFRAHLERVSERQPGGARVQRVARREGERPVAVAAAAAAARPVVRPVMQSTRRGQGSGHGVLERRRRVDGDRLERRRITDFVSSGRLAHLPPFPDRLVVDRGRSGVTTL